jgi:membrane-bound serine protease (ClpP class)
VSRTRRSRGELGACALVIGAALLAAEAHAATVNVARVSGAINPAVADYLIKAVQQSQSEGAQALVIELDTPGGLMSSTKEIVTALLNARVPVVVFVAPRGAWAGSAGTFITLAGHVAAMAPGTSIGAAHPVSALPAPSPAPEPARERDREPGRGGAERDIVGQKIENFAIAFIESIARERKRNVEWAIEAVRNSVAITSAEALQKNVVDLVAEDLGDLLERIHGRKVALSPGESVTLDTRDARVETLEMSALNRLFDVIADPQIAVLLILGGLLGLYVEFTQPGVYVPGIVGVACLVLAGLSLSIIPFNWLGLILIAAGVGLMVAELFLPTFGALFALGVVCVAFGAHSIFDVPEEMDLVVPFWRVIFPAVAAVATIGGLVAFMMARTLFHPQVAGAEGLLGASAVVDTAIRPDRAGGRVQVHGELWHAEATEPIEPGTRVRILEVRDLVVRVARADAAGTRGPTTRGGSA